MLATRTLINQVDAATDPYFSSVKLLLHMNGANGSTTFTDSSSAALTVSVNGGAQISTADNMSGFGQVGYFDGAGGSYITVAYNSILNFGTGNGTIEFWMRPASTSASYFGVVGKTAYTSGWALFQNGTTLRLFLGSASEAITTSSCLALNTWAFVQIVKSGNVWTIYVNGTSVGTTTQPGYADASKPLAIGEMNITVGWNATFKYAGKIDDFRYTPGITRSNAVPTSPFPNS